VSDERPDLSALFAPPVTGRGPGPGGRRWAMVVGIVAGAAAVVAGFWVVRSTEGADVVAASPSTTTTTEAVAAPEEMAFPPGYVPVTDLVAVRPAAGVEADDTLIITMTTAVRRGLDPAHTTPFQSGRWTLETTGGYTLESGGTAFDPPVPGTFSVLFPLGGRTDAQPVRLVLDESWQRDDRYETVDLGTVELPFELAEPIDVDLGATTLGIDGLVIASDFASMHWFTTDGRLAVVSGYLEVGGGAQPRTYGPADPSRFDIYGGPVFVDPQGSSGVVEFRLRTPVADEGSTTGDGVLSLSITLVDATPVDVEFDVTGLVVDR
jgi:hypothetical protein